MLIGNLENVCQARKRADLDRKTMLPAIRRKARASTVSVDYQRVVEEGPQFLD